MADEPLKETAPAPAVNRRTTAAPTPSSTASATATKPAKSPPAVRKKAAAKSRAKSTAKPAIKPAAPTRTTTAPSGLGVTVAGLLESSARPYVSAHEQIASATQGTWIAPVAELNARVITQVAVAQADLARRLLG
jgi:hypothetical protein